MNKKTSAFTVVCAIITIIVLWRVFKGNGGVIPNEMFDLMPSIDPIYYIDPNTEPVVPLPGGS